MTHRVLAQLMHRTALYVPCRWGLFIILSALVLSSSEGAGTATGLGLGMRHTCVIRASDSSLVCFGSNDYNELGYGSTVVRYHLQATHANHSCFQTSATDPKILFSSASLCVIVVAMAPDDLSQLQGILLIFQAVQHQM
jgi:hypothetical protein